MPGIKLNGWETKAKGDQSSKNETFGLLLELFRQTGAAKVPALLDIITDMVENQNKKVIVFGHHQDVIESISLHLKEKGIKYIRIDGISKMHLRQEYVNYFQRNEECRVAVLSITAASCGLTLTKASTVVFGELFWNPGSLLQAEDRAHRIGQTEVVDVYYVVAKDSLDEMLWDMISRKLDVLGETLNGESESLGIDTDDSMEVDINKKLEPFIEQILENIVQYEQRVRERALLKSASNSSTLPSVNPFGSSSSSSSSSSVNPFGSSSSSSSSLLSLRVDKRNSTTEAKTTNSNESAFFDDLGDDDFEIAPVGLSCPSSSSSSSSSKPPSTLIPSRSSCSTTSSAPQTDSQRFLDDDDAFDCDFDLPNFQVSEKRPLNPYAASNLAQPPPPKIVALPKSGNGVSKLASFLFKPRETS